MCCDPLKKNYIASAQNRNQDTLYFSSIKETHFLHKHYMINPNFKAELFVTFSC